MSDINVDKWKQKGNLYFWRYVENNRNYPNWNLAADEDFRDNFLDLLQRMSDAKFDSQKLLEITLPTAEVLKIPNNYGGNAKWKSPKIINLKHRKESAGDSFSFNESENNLTLIVGRQTLQLLSECFLKIRQQIDYSIQIGDTKIWFW